MTLTDCCKERRSKSVAVARGEKGWGISVTAMDSNKKAEELFGRTSLVSVSFSD